MTTTEVSSDTLPLDSASTKVSLKLPLYGYLQCPFTAKVIKRAQQLGIELELRDVNANPQHRAALLKARNATQSPVLRVSEQEWLPESADIIAYLEQQVGYVRPAWQTPLSMVFLAACIGFGVLSLVVKGALSTISAGLAVAFMLAWRGSKR